MDVSTGCALAQSLRCVFLECPARTAPRRSAAHRWGCRLNIIVDQTRLMHTVACKQQKQQKVRQIQPDHGGDQQQFAAEE